MNSLPLPLFVGLALLYAAAGTAAWGGLAFALGRRSMMRAMPTVFAILVFLAMALTPLPRPGSLECPVRGAEANWVPFRDAVLREMARAVRAEDIGAWLLGHDLVALGMNLVLCGVIGALLARHRLRLRMVVPLAFAVSLMVELTQLTGIWGVYPCAFRTFDVDDLMLNTFGTGLGFWLARQRAGRGT